ncbi:hypothetical protein IFO69_10565 [Echinicola sp. CAU 1574]|uniref:Uncharacterized protein n=1 Tax=Echinicola arenosa TaxID=2774144 RepID=A0ABR9AK67_9BACT|nr:hypothetical protein [Echinicola arenosa]MBD8489188.1 hypothetical protein [Echinicola arenosa]
MNLKGGALIIGSLFWQDYRDNKNDSKDKKRKEWRDKHLDMTSAKDVVVPIRYGRFSSKDGGTYTMVFDNSLNRDQYGVAKAVGFEKSDLDVKDIVNIVKNLSNVEGGDHPNFIKGSSAWCVCGILFNPELSDEDKNSLRDRWEIEMKKNGDGYKVFINKPELYSMTKSGELDIPWPEGLDDLDFLLATSTRPRDEKGDNRIIPPKEIAEYIPNREYVIPNIMSGIRTFQDEEVLNRYLKALSHDWKKDDIGEKGLIAFEHYYNLEKFYKNLPNFKEVVENAGNAVVPNNTTGCDNNKTMFAGHQNRVGKKRCQDGAELLLQAPFYEALEKAKSFEDIFEITEEVKTKVFGLGDLWSYDTAQRIGLAKSYYPKAVYLQTGTLLGAKELVKRGLVDGKALRGQRSVPQTVFSKVFRDLPCYMIENLLCVGHNQKWFT